jgi:hypothetical protein
MLVYLNRMREKEGASAGEIFIGMKIAFIETIFCLK